MDMLKNFVFPVMEKDMAEFLQHNGAPPIFSSYSYCWVGRGIHFVQSPRFPDLSFLKV
jgi:hypothetical protein